MSQIRGNGHGDKHDWERKETEQNIFSELRSTRYWCRKCNIMFYHFYHVVPNIFEQMEKSDVPEDCI
jgi:nitrate reductase cytochrome c-type subunit